MSFSDSDSSVGSGSGSDSDPERDRHASGRDGKLPARGKAGKGGWQLESLMMEDEAAMGTMGRMLERLRREPPPTDKRAELMGARPFFLHPKQIMNVTRTGADRQVSSVLWPKTLDYMVHPTKGKRT